jgi:hypothetical protein
MLGLELDSTEVEKERRRMRENDIVLEDLRREMIVIGSNVFSGRLWGFERVLLEILCGNLEYK